MRNIANILKEAQRYQEMFADMKREIESQEVTASAGGGMVEVTVNGMQKILRVKIDPEVVDRENVEMLEDLILAATAEAQSRAQELVQQKTQAITGGLNIPGLSNLFS